MLGIIEVLMFLCGAWALITAKLPTWAFGKQYRLEGGWARIVGIIWMAPLALGLTLGIVVALLTDGEGTIFVGVGEIILMLAAFIIARMISRRYGQQVAVA